MPQFAPGAAKTAVLSFPVSPNGLQCTVELYLTKDRVTKVATSGPVSFVSTGSAQNVSLSITMPSVSDTYLVYADVVSGGVRIGAYQATDNVVITAPAFIYSNASAVHTPVAEAPAWWYPAFRCRVTNPTSSTMTRQVTFRIVPRPGGSVMNSWTESGSMTLAAGAFADWVFINSLPGGYCKTAYGTPNPLDCWLEDDAGGKSVVVLVS